MIGTNLAITTKNYAVAGGVTYDADALAYFTANTAITSSTDKNAINDFYLGLKSDGIYTKIKAMYFPIWGSAASSKWNLVNPLDTNAAFRLTFATGMTFTSSGMTSNGSSGYANTNFIPTANLTNNNTAFGIYSRSNIDGLGYDTGLQVAGSCVFALVTRYLGNYITDQYINTTNRISAANTDSRGFFQSIRTTSTSFKAFKNGSQIGTTNTNASTGFSSSTINFLICCINDTGTPNYYSTRQYSFFYIGNSLTDTEAANFSNRVNILMTYFGINVYNSWLDESSWNDSNNWTD